MIDNQPNSKTQSPGWARGRSSHTQERVLIDELMLCCEAELMTKRSASVDIDSYVDLAVAQGLDPRCVRKFKEAMEITRATILAGNRRREAVERCLTPERIRKGKVRLLKKLLRRSNQGRRATS